MIIAVPFENGDICQHYGHCKHMKVYEVYDGEIADCAVVTVLGDSYEQRADFLLSYNTDALICGGMGDGSREALGNFGISIYAGVTGSADAAVSDFLSGNLKYDPGASCNHQHGEGHSCCCGSRQENGDGCCCGGNHEEGCGCC
ncbi:MAG: dinitrogenase iron-molybdenum cofactor biosynthesis protein [Clostridia bacterium]|nr:dinitrogenase iron-molybdenum cofactor biosynthesis protein [Clostridia bacterium]